MFKQFINSFTKEKNTDYFDFELQELLCNVKNLTNVCINCGEYTDKNGYCRNQKTI